MEKTDLPIIEAENTSNQYIIVIDDDPQNLRPFSDHVRQFPGVDTYFVTPDKLDSVPDDIKRSTMLVMADQHLHKAVPVAETQAFIRNLSRVNETFKVIEISYSPKDLAYEESIGTIDSLNLKTGFEGNMRSWPKTKEGLLMKLKWKANRGFMFANNLENGQGNLELVVKHSYKMIIKSRYFEHFLKIAGVSEDEFKARYNDLALESQAEFLHDAWQTVGHLMSENGSEYYSMPLQRFQDQMKS